MGHDRRGTSISPDEAARDADAMAVSPTQRLVSGIVPRPMTAAMEAESRQWMVRCRTCGFERSIWELGGIRWKAKGTSWTWRRCPHCGKRRWHTIYRRDPLTSPPETSSV